MGNATTRSIPPDPTASGRWSDRVRALHDDDAGMSTAEYDFDSYTLHP